MDKIILTELIKIFFQKPQFDVKKELEEDLYLIQNQHNTGCTIMKLKNNCTRSGQSFALVTQIVEPIEDNISLKEIVGEILSREKLTIMMIKTLKQKYNVSLSVGSLDDLDNFYVYTTSAAELDKEGINILYIFEKLEELNESLVQK